MNSPYMGNFKVTQQYKSDHTGLDLVGIDSKNIHSTINGTVTKAGWENPNNHAQGWGLRVTIQKDGTNQYYTFGHLSQIKVVVGQKVKITEVIGVEGSTGYSTGSHCHYECRLNNERNQHQDISKISGIPNAIGTYNDGYTGTPTETPTETYFEIPNYGGVSIVEALNAIGENSSYSYRKIIADRNMIYNYTGTPTQNTQMLDLLKKGKLIKCL